MLLLIKNSTAAPAMMHITGLAMVVAEVLEPEVNPCSKRITLTDVLAIPNYLTIKGLVA